MSTSIVFTGQVTFFGDGPTVLGREIDVIEKNLLYTEDKDLIVELISQYILNDRELYLNDIEIKVLQRKFGNLDFSKCLDWLIHFHKYSPVIKVTIASS